MWSLGLSRIQNDIRPHQRGSWKDHRWDKRKNRSFDAGALGTIFFRPGKNRSSYSEKHRKKRSERVSSRLTLLGSGTQIRPLTKTWPIDFGGLALSLRAPEPESHAGPNSCHSRAAAVWRRRLLCAAVRIGAARLRRSAHRRAARPPADLGGQRIGHAAAADAARRAVHHQLNCAVGRHRRTKPRL